MKLNCAAAFLLLLASSHPIAQGREGGPPAAGSGAPNQPARMSQVGTPVPSSGSFTIGTLNADRNIGASYPRVVQLQHYTPARGQLLATFARQGAPLPVYRSTDNGDTWQQISEVRGLRGQPSLYELPQQCGSLPPGTVLAAGLAEPQPDPAKTALTIYASGDGGKTWEFLSVIADGQRAPYDPAQRAGITKLKPVWEPFLYLDGKGRLIASFSDERYKDDNYNQILVHRVSEDGGRHWGPVKFDVAVPDGLTRAGMAIVTRLPNNKFFMIYEMVGLPGYPLEPRSNPVHFRMSDNGEDFGNPADRGTLIQDRWRQFLWATPYISWSPYGGPNGTLIASARAVLRYELGQVGNGVMINRALGEGYWTLIETPIRYTPGPGGYSQTVIPLGDGKTILQLVPVDGDIRYAKFALPE